MHLVNIYEVNIYHGDSWDEQKEFKTEKQARAFVEKFNKEHPGDVPDFVARYAPDEE